MVVFVGTRNRNLETVASHDPSLSRVPTSHCSAFLTKLTFAAVPSLFFQKHLHADTTLNIRMLIQNIYVPVLQAKQNNDVV